MVDVPIIQLGSIRIKLDRRPFPTASSAWDRDAIEATLEVKLDAFQGQVTTYIWSRELEELYRILTFLDQRVGHEENVSFTLREHTLSLQFELTRLGHLHVRAEVTDMTYPTDPVTLTFVDLSDQTMLPGYIREVKQALKIFPLVSE
jgi:hypothetical protein